MRFNKYLFSKYNNYFNDLKEFKKILESLYSISEKMNYLKELIIKSQNFIENEKQNFLS